MFLCITIKFWDIGADFGSYSPSSLLWKKKKRIHTSDSIKATQQIWSVSFQNGNFSKGLGYGKKEFFIFVGLNLGFFLKEIF